MKLSITQNFDTLPYISACFSNTITEISRWNIFYRKEGQFSFFNPYYCVLDKNNKCKYCQKLFNKIPGISNLPSHVTLCVFVCPWGCLSGPGKSIHYHLPILSVQLHLDIHLQIFFVNVLEIKFSCRASIQHWMVKKKLLDIDYVIWDWEI